MDPSYLSLYKSGELTARVGEALVGLRRCNLCPRNCGVDRTLSTGACRTGRFATISSSKVHFGEEPPISGIRGSGTIFFTNCNLHCLYCQNFPISQYGYGQIVSSLQLAEMMLDLQNRGCHNANFVTPSHVVPQILEGLLEAIPLGFHLPLVYNTSGYDSLKALRLMDGVIDIYLPDMRYADNWIAQELSGVGDYVERNREAIREMARQAGGLRMDEKGIAEKGVIIRHLVLPTGLAGTWETMRFIAEEISADTYISFMAQYFPAYRAKEHPRLKRVTSQAEYNEAAAALQQFGLGNGWLQGLEDTHC